MTLNFDVVVIGSGPAGMTAAIFLKRANVNVALLDSNAPGGQLNRIANIENYPGFSKIAGSDLAYNMFNQTQDLGIIYKYGKVIDVINKKNYKVVKTDKEDIYCKGIIIATGRKPKELGLPNEKRLIGRGISWCAICDGSLFKGKDVIVVGGGNSALEESLYLSNIANKVSIVHHSSQFGGEKVLQKGVLARPNISVHFDSEVTNLIVENNVLTGIEITNKDNGKSAIEASGLFIYIGFEPSIDFLNNLRLRERKGYIIVNDNMQTNIKGIYACGDVIDKNFYQITTAISEGSKAAMSAIKFLEE
ncbi:MAG: FAD-dependent oxidoreductase [Bacilli bacterium]|jgi:thioredoxin reductase (NADPH)